MKPDSKRQRWWKRSDTWIFVGAAFLWLLTFVVAISDCSIQQFLRMECTAWLLGSGPTEKFSEAKGQFGDSFGVLNGAFGALTLWLVYRTYRRETESNAEQIRLATETLEAQRKSNTEQIRLATEALDSERKSSAAQIELVRIERYYSEIEAAKQAYNRLLQAVAIQDHYDKRSWAAAHGLFFGWRFIAKLVRQSNTQLVPSRTDSQASLRIFLAMWRPVSVSYRWHDIRSAIDNYSPETYEPEHFTARWVESQIDLLDDDANSKYLSSLVKNWRETYSSNVYQYDALFRAWYHVCKAIANVSEFQIDAATEWRAAASWRAQLSWIEMVYLLCNQCLSEGETGNGFPRAVEFSERYAMFDNFQPGIDPAAHLLSRVARGYLSVGGARRLNDEAFASDLARKKLR